VKGFWRKVLLTMGFAPLLFLFNEYYLKKNFSEAPIKKNKVKEVVIKTLAPGNPVAELKVLNHKVSRKSTEVVLLEKAQDFSRSIKELLPELKDKWQEEAKGLLENLENCQEKDFCGMEPDEDGYFDETQTHARKSQLRLISLLNEAYNEKKEAKFLLPTRVLESFVHSENSELAREAALQLHRKGKLKEVLSNMKGKALINSLELINKESLSDEEMQTLIEDSLNGADPYTTVLVFEKLKNLNFNESGFQGILKAVCHLKTGMKHNWKAVVALSDEITTDRKFNTNIKSVCQ
jgi:hypothetical protein